MFSDTNSNSDFYKILIDFEISTSIDDFDNSVVLRTVLEITISEVTANFEVVSSTYCKKGSRWDIGFVLFEVLIEEYDDRVKEESISLGQRKIIAAASFTLK